MCFEIRAESDERLVGRSVHLWCFFGVRKEKYRVGCALRFALKATDAWKVRVTWTYGGVGPAAGKSFGDHASRPKITHVSRGWLRGAGAGVGRTSLSDNDLGVRA